MQINIRIVTPGQDDAQEVKFNSFGAGALATLNAIANGMQVKSLVSMSFDSINLAPMTGREFIDFIKTLGV